MSVSVLRAIFDSKIIGCRKGVPCFRPVWYETISSNVIKKVLKMVNLYSSAVFVNNMSADAQQSLCFRHMSVKGPHFTSDSTVSSKAYSDRQKGSSQSFALLALCVGFTPVKSGFPTQRVSYVEIVSMSWRHYEWTPRKLFWYSTNLLVSWTNGIFQCFKKQGAPCNITTL